MSLLDDLNEEKNNKIIIPKKIKIEKCIFKYTYKNNITDEQLKTLFKPCIFSSIISIRDSNIISLLKTYGEII